LQLNPFEISVFIIGNNNSLLTYLDIIFKLAYLNARYGIYIDLFTLRIIAFPQSLEVSRAW